MSKVLVTESYLSDIADAIRTKSGGGTTYKPSEMAQGILDIPSGGGGGFSIEDYLGHQFTGSATFTDSDVGFFSLQNQTGITSLSFPNATTLGNVSAGGFSGMTGLISFSAPKATRVPSSMLNGNTSMTSVNLDKLDDTSTNLLYGCASLPVVVLPSVKTIYSQTFRNCNNLESLDVLGTNGFTNQNNMNGCTKLNKLIIRKNGVATLSNINNFTGTPFASNGTGGTLYVPQAQIASYQSATNWSTILSYTNNQILPIEGSYYETHYADGTEIL